MDLLIQQLQQALECPCCMEKPKPGVNTVGMCSSGHMTCHRCFQQISLQNQVVICPVCRQSTFKLIRGHQLATTLIQIMSHHSTYTCQHPGCGEQVNGAFLKQHEQSCSEKPVVCPRDPKCFFMGPIKFFLDGQHARCVTVCSVTEQSQSWNLIWDMSTLFSFDTCDINIPDRFKPVLLKGVLASRNNFVSHAYLTAKVVGGNAVIYIGWMNSKIHLEEKYQNAQFSIFVYVNTPNGKAGQFVVKSPKFEDSGQLVRQEHGIFLPRHTLYNWAEFTKDYKCYQCHHKKGHPHLHIQITLQ